MWWNINKIMKCTKCHSVLVVITNSFIVSLNLLQKKAIFETFLGFCCYEKNCSNSIE